MNKGILFIVSAPSGTGKSSLIQEILKKVSFYKITVSVSYTTRMIRPGEENGKHYFFVSEKEFKNMIDTKKFLEYAKVFNHYYGTAQKKINNILIRGIDVFLNIDWQGAQQIRQKIPESRSIFIFPPSNNELFRRIKARGQDSNVVILKRMKEAVEEMSHYSEYDYLIINDNFKIAVSDLKSIIYAEHLSIKQQKYRNISLIQKLLNHK
ncbi:guanylate kinase [Buchnera aphidicola (Pemphigus obesinymphae)]|uniref:guanylate kinase n=1 Tax=Buchnera aphidicola TaxID=9 RepID=UPI00223789AD|nr:guanylate kinase [Buchnera aphidicola]MCW5196726.1 guanylate kinase [Buchnera aphidicola (Pemphigus obesinymphae)]